MPIPLQIKTIRRILSKANPSLAEEIDFKNENSFFDKEGELHDWTVFVDDFPLRTNITFLEYRFPSIKWRLPEAPKEESLNPRKSIEVYKCETSEGPVLCMDIQIVVQPHKSKSGRISKQEKRGGREYTHGRIQITTPEELINETAHVHIEFPNPPEVKKKTRRSKRDLRYYQIPDDFKFTKKPDRTM
jgi:hypothetical protein